MIKAKDLPKAPVYSAMGLGGLIRATYFHRYVEGTRFSFNGNFVCYWSDHGRTSSHSQWMVPGTDSEDPDYKGA